MTIQDLLKFCQKEHKRIQEAYKIDDIQKYRMANFIKLTEELGELGDEVLRHDKTQRVDKLKKQPNSKVGEELVDVLITLLILGQGYDIDIEGEIKKKMKKIEKRIYT